eukprot:161994-Chlamydomonas_euryale.AAC.1
MAGPASAASACEDMQQMNGWMGVMVNLGASLSRAACFPLGCVRSHILNSGLLDACHGTFADQHACMYAWMHACTTLAFGWRPGSRSMHAYTQASVWLPAKKQAHARQRLAVS